MILATRFGRIAVMVQIDTQDYIGQISLLLKFSNFSLLPDLRPLKLPCAKVLRQKNFALFAWVPGKPIENPDPVQPLL